MYVSAEAVDTPVLLQRARDSEFKRQKTKLQFKASEQMHFFKLTYSPTFPELSRSCPQTEQLQVLNVAVRRSSNSGNSSSGSC